MEKLIELLNEYEKTTFEEDTNWVYEGEEWEYYEPNDRIIKGNWENEEILTQYELCSKQFGFIKWLVENEKIETNNLNLKVFKSMFSNDGTVEISYEELVLMLLAISDEPIEFLISILKNV